MRWWWTNKERERDRLLKSIKESMLNPWYSSSSITFEALEDAGLWPRRAELDSWLRENGLILMAIDYELQVVSVRKHVV